ncbi:peptidoglycan DD-metalloendopeptidase family protein [Rhodospirillaceae bacterium SYSU D60014]|uniref:murein hydrolase activator EnvC family protein n=1 Tax=Virgifigura deserti TaxID=2268457 RepID=UPI0013C459C4
MFIAANAQAQETPRRQAREGGERLERIERDLEADRNRVETLKSQAAALAEEIAALRAEMIAAAGAAQDYEEEVSQLEDSLAVVEKREREKSAALDRRRSQLSQALAALQRLALQPPEALIIGPDSPIDTVRSAMLLKVAVPALQTQATALQQQLGELRDLREQAEQKRKKMAVAVAALEAENDRIAALIERKHALRQTTAKSEAAAAERVAALAREAENLRDLIARLTAKPPPRKPTQTAMLFPVPPPPPRLAPDTAEPAAVMRLPTPETIRTFPAEQASLTMPARGELVTLFDETSSVGLTSKGVRIATREQAQIVAPFDGQVVFRGPFRGYGEILILEHRGGYHSLLVGLGRTDAEVGQWLLAGEPVGIMGPAMDGSPELYLELRHDGEPINPLPWLKTRDSEVE